MVFYFTLLSKPEYICYMGRDKYENEELLRWGWPEDLWFHVDAHSSAHVYLRMSTGQGMDDLPASVINECCQLTKHNSIEGCKIKDVKVVYTPWTNLKKTNGMEVGQVGFHKEALRRYAHVTKDPVLLNSLEKTRVELNTVNFQEERETRDGLERSGARKQEEERRKREQVEKEDLQKQLDLKHYTSLSKEAMTSNKEQSRNEDDFM